MDDVTAVALDALRREPAGPAARFLLPDQPSGLAARVADKASLAATCRRLGVPHPRTSPRPTPRRPPPWPRPWACPSSPVEPPVAAPARHRTARHGLRGPVGRPGPRAVRPPRRGRQRPPAPAVPARGPRPGLVLPRVLRPLRRYRGVAATGRKVRSWPDGAGLTAAGVWAPNPAVERTARDLVSALGYRGIADLDFRLDPGTGTYHLLDSAPRRAVPAVRRRLGARRGPRAAPGPDGAPGARPGPLMYGRRFVVENYAALSCSRRPGPAPARAPGCGAAAGARSGPGTRRTTRARARDGPCVGRPPGAARLGGAAPGLAGPGAGPAGRADPRAAAPLPAQDSLPRP